MDFKVFLSFHILLYFQYLQSIDADDFLSLIDKLFRGTGNTLLYGLTLGHNQFNADQEVTFWCFLPGGQTYQQVFINDVNLVQKIDVSKPLNFVIHGFLSSFRGGMIANYEGPTSDSWPYQMSSDWSKFTQSNTCAVDWSRMAVIEYGLAANNVRTVADQMIRFMNIIVSVGITIDKVSVAGHSLGAHAAGFFGAAFRGQLNAIFGLDAAGPGFTAPFLKPPQDRLDPTDAKFVQCLHTSVIFGTYYDCGHADFKANDGAVQPGCNLADVLCNHSRAAILFRYALDPAIRFLATGCAKQNFGLIGNIVTKMSSLILPPTCTEITSDVFGVYTNRFSGDYKFTTTATPPYVVA